MANQADANQADAKKEWFPNEIFNSIIEYGGIEAAAQFCCTSKRWTMSGYLRSQEIALTNPRSLCLLLRTVLESMCKENSPREKASQDGPTSNDFEHVGKVITDLNMTFPMHYGFGSRVSNNSPRRPQCGAVADYDGIAEAWQTVSETIGAEVYASTSANHLLQMTELTYPGSPTSN